MKKRAGGRRFPRGSGLRGSALRVPAPARGEQLSAWQRCREPSSSITPGSRCWWHFAVLFKTNQVLCHPTMPTTACWLSPSYLHPPEESMESQFQIRFRASERPTGTAQPPFPLLGAKINFFRPISKSEAPLPRRSASPLAPNVALGDLQAVPSVETLATRGGLPQHCVPPALWEDTPARQPTRCGGSERPTG